MVEDIPTHYETTEELMESGYEIMIWLGMALAQRCYFRVNCADNRMENICKI